MLRYILTSVVGGILFGVMDGVIHANPYGQKLLAVYKPIAKDAINAPLGIAIDLVYGFVMAGLFTVLYKSLPGETWVIKGLSYGLIMWFFRTVMYTASHMMMFKVPAGTSAYVLFTGLAEMLILGLVFGFALKP